MTKIEEYGYGLYKVKIRTVLHSIPPFIKTTIKGLHCEPLLGGYYKCWVNLEGENKKELMEKASKIEEILNPYKK